MPATPESGFLILADLTGYTAYLSGSEIEHAPAIAGDLLETRGRGRDRGDAGRQGGRLRSPRNDHRRRAAGP